MKVLIEDFGVNSRYVMEHEQVEWNLRQRPADEQLLQKQQQLLAQMAAQGQDMKRQFYKMQAAADEFFKRFDDLHSNVLINKRR